MFVSGHRRQDMRSLRMHEAIAEKLRRDPVPVLAKARANLDRWRDSSTPSRYLGEWERLLNGPADQLLALLLDESEDAIALRHASPFAGVLTPQERWDIYRSFREEWPIASRPV